jgi:hypothetical protein
VPPPEAPPVVTPASAPGDLADKLHGMLGSNCFSEQEALAIIERATSDQDVHQINLALQRLLAEGDWCESVGSALRRAQGVASIVLASNNPTGSTGGGQPFATEGYPPPGGSGGNGYGNGT